MQNCFCLFYRPNDWRIAAGIFVNANAKVNLTIARIGLKQLAKPQNGVGFCRLEFVLHAGLVREGEMSFMFRANHWLKATIFHMAVWATTPG